MLIGERPLAQAVKSFERADPITLPFISPESSLPTCTRWLVAGDVLIPIAFNGDHFEFICHPRLIISATSPAN